MTAKTPEDVGSNEFGCLQKNVSNLSDIPAGGVPFLWEVETLEKYAFERPLLRHGPHEDIALEYVKLFRAHDEPVASLYE